MLYHVSIYALMNFRTEFSAIFRKIVIGWLLGSCLLLAGCRLSDYKRDEQRIPRIRLGWVNEKAEDRKLNTGGTEMKIRVWSEKPIPKPYTLIFSYRGGYTNQSTVLPIHHGRGNTKIDTTYAFVTKMKAEAHDDSQIAVHTLVRSGRYGQSASERYELGMSLNWLVRVGNFSYSDGAGNTTCFGSIIWHYKPARPEDSISGIYNGGAEAKKTVTEVLKDSLLSHVRRIVRDTSKHTNKRLKGTGLLQFKHNSWKLTYIINRNSPQKEAFEEFLKETFQED